jgi:hypothetical protein
MGLVDHVPGVAIAALAVIFYPGLGLLLPLALNWQSAWLIDANVIGVCGAAVLSLGWFAAQVEAAKRRHLIEWTTEFRHLDAEEFEWLVGEMFRREGWTVEETGRHGAPDGNVDLRLNRHGERRLVQCKRWTAWEVNVDQIRSFAGTLLREGLPGRAGIFVTLSQFNGAAVAEADKAGIHWIDGRHLAERIEKVRRPQACPVCGRPMLLDRSPHGWWLRCVAEGCRGKRDLGAEPGRAVEFLTQPPLSGRP